MNSEASVPRFPMVRLPHIEQTRTAFRNSRSMRAMSLSKIRPPFSVCLFENQQRDRIVLHIVNINKQPSL